MTLYMTADSLTDTVRCVFCRTHLLADACDDRLSDIMSDNLRSCYTTRHANFYIHASLHCSALDGNQTFSTMTIRTMDFSYHP